MTYPPNWQQSRWPSPQPWELHIEHRITQAEDRLNNHDEMHDTQRVWNRTFAIALLSLGSAIAHGNASTLAGLLVLVAERLKP